jgi:hypothetical protein
MKCCSRRRDHALALAQTERLMMEYDKEIWLSQFQYCDENSSQMDSIGVHRTEEAALDHVREIIAIEWDSDENEGNPPTDRLGMDEYCLEHMHLYRVIPVKLDD